jgi:ABC-type polysaccharide/polyol phosphate export permease
MPPSVVNGVPRRTAPSDSAHVDDVIAQPPGALARAQRAFDVLHALTSADMRVRYGRDPTRVVRWLLDPYAAAGVYLLLVAFVLDRPGEAPGLSIACAIVPFQIVIMAFVNGLTAVQLRRSIIANMRFERRFIPLASAISEATGFAAALSLIVVMMVAYRVAPTIQILWLPVLLLVTMLLAIAIAYPAALLGLWYPHLRPFAISAARTLFFLAPGMVALDQMHGSAQKWIRANPLTGLFEAFRAVFLYGRAPAAWELLYPTVTALVLLAVFVPLFSREQGQFAKLLE